MKLTKITDATFKVGTPVIVTKNVRGNIICKGSYGKIIKYEEPNTEMFDYGGDCSEQAYYYIKFIKVLNMNGKDGYWGEQFNNKLYVVKSRVKELSWKDKLTLLIK